MPERRTRGHPGCFHREDTNHLRPVSSGSASGSGSDLTGGLDRASGDASGMHAFALRGAGFIHERVVNLSFRGENGVVRI